MTVILIFIFVIVGLNCIPVLTKINSPKLDKVISRMLIYTIITFVIFKTLLVIDYRLKGLYSNFIINLTFIISSLLFFSLIKNSRAKIVKVILLTPLILISLFTLIFGQIKYECKINDTYKIEVSNGGFLSCGENIKIRKSDFGIFEKAIYSESSLCLIGISKIETIRFDKNQAEFLIYHDGKMDSENPYNYKIENKNVW